MWCKEDLTTEEQAKKNRELNNGKIFSVEDTAAHDDDWDVNIGCHRSFSWCFRCLARS